jgi:hypothetical protein
MDSLYADLPTAAMLSDTVNAARDTLRLAVAYDVAHRRLALADVVVRAAADFTGAQDEETSSIALDNLFDAVEKYRTASLEQQSRDADVLSVVSPE